METIHGANTEETPSPKACVTTEGGGGDIIQGRGRGGGGGDVNSVVDGARCSRQKGGKNSRSKSSSASASSDESSDSVCNICLEPLQIYAIGQCLHKSSCGNCFISNRFLYDRDTCSVCFKNLEDVAIVRNSGRGGGELIFSSKLKCHFDDRSYMREQEEKLKFTCSECKTSHRNIGALKAHAKEAHKKEYCNICLTKRKVFFVEQRLYCAKDMETHRNKGDLAQGQDGPLPAHTRCKVSECKAWCYDYDDMVQHTLTSHCCCHICKKKGTEVWLNDNSSLIKHYRSAHLSCDSPDCITNPLENVFEDELSLQAHILRTHSKDISREDLLRMRRVTIASNTTDNYPSLHRRNGSSSNSSSSSGGGPSYNNNQNSNKSTSDDPNPPLRPISKVEALGSSDNRDLSLASLLKDNLNNSRSEIEAFRNDCSLFLQRITDPGTFYHQFIRRFSASTDRALIWMQLVGSLPDPYLRSKLNEQHFEYIKTGQGFSIRKEEEVFRFNANTSRIYSDIMPTISSNEAQSDNAVDIMMSGGAAVRNDIGSNTNEKSNISGNNATLRKTSSKVGGGWANIVKPTDMAYDDKEVGLVPSLATIPSNSFWNLGANSSVKHKDAKCPAEVNGVPAALSNNAVTGSQKKFGKGKNVTVIKWG